MLRHSSGASEAAILSVFQRLGGVVPRELSGQIQVQL